MVEFGLPLSPAPSPVPSVRRLRIHSPPPQSNEHAECEIQNLFKGLSKEAQARVLKEVLKNSDREVLLEARNVIESRLRHDPFKVLPTEISLKILTYITSPKNLAAAAQVSRRWYCLLKDDRTWERMCGEHRFRRLSVVNSYVHHWRLERASSEVIEETVEDDDEVEAPNVLSVGEGSRARRSSLLRLGSGTDPNLRYSSRVPSWTGDFPVYYMSDDAERDPIGEAYYDSRACLVTVPDSYRSHFQQQYMQNQAWESGGLLAGRYILPNHTNVIVTAVLMQDGYIVVALDSSLILVFHSDGKLVRSLYGHVMGVWTLALRGKTLISGGCDRDIREWDLNTGHCVKILRGHTSTVRCLALEHGIAISGSRDTTVRVWNLQGYSVEHVLCGHTASVRRVEFLPVEGDYGRRNLRAVSASYDGTAIIWDLNTGARLHTLRGHTNQIYALAVNSSYIVTGSLDHSIRVWDPNTGKALACLLGHTALVGQLALRDTLLVSGGSDGSVRVWDLTRFRCTHRIAAHDNTVSCLSLAGDRVVTGGPDCRVTVWDVLTGERIRTLEKNTVTTVWAVAALEDRLLTVYSEGSDIVIELMSFVPPPVES